MNAEQPKPIPRMRTAAKIVAEIRAMDPESDISEHYVRQLIKSGALPVVWAGNKALVNLDDVLELMRHGTKRAMLAIVYLPVMKQESAAIATLSREIILIELRRSQFHFPRV